MYSHLVIPYYESDTGDRLIEFSTKHAISWLCPSIKINGGVYTTSSESLRGDIKITVDVSNYGNKDAHATLRLFWAKPSCGFSSPTLKPIASTDFNVIPSINNPSPEITWKEEDRLDIPEHICIVAVVESFGDNADGLFDPSSDRHYGQLNIRLMHNESDILQPVVIFITNPYPNDSIATVHLRQLSDGQLHLLESLYNAKSVQINLQSVHFQLIENNQDELSSSELFFELGPYERRPCQVIVPHMHQLKELEFAAIEIEEILKPLSDNKEVSMKASYGTLGIVIFGS